MTIIYSVICRAKDATILTEVCDRDLKGTFGSVWLELFQHLRDHPDFFKDGDLKTFVQRNQAEMDFFSHFLEACSAVLNKDDDINNSNPETFFHIFFNNGVFYGCLGDDSDTRDQKVNFAFLHHIEKEFTKMHRSGRIKTANAYSLDKNFGPTMRAAMHYHNIHHKEIRQDEKVNKLVSKVQDIRVLMGRNLNMILERGEKFEGLLTRSEDLSKDAQVFKKKAKTAKYMMMRKYYYWSAALMALLVFIIYLITIATCGMRLQHCRREGDNNNSNEESDSSNGEDNNNGDNNGEDGGN